MKKAALDRLLESAAKVPARPVVGLDWTLEQKLLATWRRSGSAGDFAGLVSLFRHGAAIAGGIAAVAVAVSWQGGTADRSAGMDVEAMADEAIVLAWNP